MSFNTRPVGRAFKKKIPGMRFREGNVKSLVVHLVVCTTSLTYRERQRQRETEKEIQIFVFKSFVLHSLALHPWIRSLWSLNQHPHLSNGDNTFLIWWLQEEMFVNFQE